MKVDVYYNLHKHCWSVRHKGKVIKHTDRVVLIKAKFVVQPAGRQRVLKEKKKNVHAFVRGIMLPDDWEVETHLLPTDEVTYNPYKYKTFVKKQTEEPVHQCNWVIMDNKKVWGLGCHAKDA